MPSIETDRLLIRPPEEGDRERFVELFTDPDFGVFGDGGLDQSGAHLRFDRMLWLARRVPYAKQPIIDKATGQIAGYTGAGTVTFDELDRLEWGWRLAVDMRGRGIATEAALALLDFAHTQSDGEMLCIIDVRNAPSRRTADKVGFEWQQQVTWPDAPNSPTDLLTISIGAGGSPLLAPPIA